jgi:hypothetical protein
MQPDLVWIKARNNTGSHQLIDSVRGIPLFLFSDATSADSSRPNSFTSFNSNGYTVGSSSDGNTNLNTYTYVGWQWKAGGTAVSNIVGTITSSVSANTTAGFSVVTYTGTGANATVGHGLGAVPGMIIVKNRTSGVPSWRVYHSALPYTSYLYLDTTNAAFTGGGVWTQTPTTTLFGINGTDAGVGTANNYVAYCWAPVAGYSAFGSYTGNGSADGPFIYTGFRPRWIMFKRTDATQNWQIFDTARDIANPEVTTLFANLANAEGGGYVIDYLSNGFKPRAADTGYNASGGTYIYAAFAENPLKYANAR